MRCRRPPHPKRSPAEDLCVQCGLCCNGTIFADLKLSAEDLGRVSKVCPELAKKRLLQPCPALESGLCQIYSARPDHCRSFECLVLKRYLAGALSGAKAMTKIRSARRRASKVERLLRALGNTDGRQGLSARFREVTRKMHSGAPDCQRLALYGELTVAMQDLQSLLAREFYPGP